MLVRAAGGRVAADIWQLIRSGKLLAGRLEVDAPTIEFTRLGPTRFALASEIELGGEGASFGTLKMTDLPSGRLLIRHAALTVTNWNQALPQLMLRDVNLDMRRDAHDVALKMAAQLPASLGDELSIDAEAHGGAELKTVSWKALMHVRGISFPGWRQLLPEYLANLDSGSGQFTVAVTGRGAVLARADADFAAANVVTQLGEGPITKFDQLSGALSLVHQDDGGWTLAGKGVRVGRHDPESAFSASWHESDAGLLDVRVSASYLRAETLLPLTGFLPQRDLRDRLREFAPSGEWSDTYFALARNQVGEPWRMQVQAKFQRAGFAAVKGVPGLRGIAGSIAGNERGGEVVIDTQVGVFNWPAQLPHPVDLEQLKTHLYWQRTDPELLIATPEWLIRTHDGEVQGQAAWRQPSDGSSPLLTLVGTIKDGNVANARNYLLKGLLGPGTLAWLDRAFVAGRMTHASLLFKGPVHNFPFRDGGGIFLARCAIEGMTLDYAEGWPPVENLAATVEFRNQGMTGRMSSARIADLGLESGEANFPDFSTGELKVHAAARGDAGAALGYLSATPLEATTEHAFSSVQATGALRATVDLFLPFKDFQHRQVLIQGHLDGASVNKVGSTITASDVGGDFDIDGGQVARADIHGQLLGGAFQMQARVPRSRPLTRTQLEFRGSFAADAVRAALSVPNNVSITGQSDWRAVLKISPEPARERSLRLSSTLVGIESMLPAPLDKSAATPLPSWIELQWPASGGAQGSLALGTLVNSAFTLESDSAGVRLAHAAVTFGATDTAANSTQMIDVGGSVQRLDLAGWLRLATPGKNAKPLDYYMRTAKLNVAELDYLGLAFRDLALDLAVSDRSWRVNVAGPNVMGTLTVPSASGAADPWSLQFDRLRFDVPDAANPADPGGAADSSERPPAASSAQADPRAIPAIDFHAAELIWGERQFGDVTATLSKLDDGVSLPSLSVIGANFTVSAHGDWRGKDAGISHIRGTLASSDVQNTLKDLGYAPVIQAKSGKMDFDLTWPGGPSAQLVAQVAGHIQLSLEKGQVTGLKPGAGRVLGLASIAALPRRLALDFSDLTDKGLAFDSVHGDFDLRDGNAYTENVLLKGPAAEIGLIGRVGLKNKDYDQTAVVTGSVGNSLSIPLASALVGGPVVGAAVLLFTQVFKQPLKGLARGYYRITGSWDNPIVERIKSAGAAAATAEAPK